MKLKLEPLTLIICLIIVAGTYTGGFFHGRATRENPVYITNHVSQYQTQEQWQAMVSVEVEDCEFESNITVMIEDVTNVTVFEVENGETNRSAGLDGFPPFPRAGKGE